MGPSLCRICHDSSGEMGPILVQQALLAGSGVCRTRFDAFQTQAGRIVPCPHFGGKCLFSSSVGLVITGSQPFSRVSINPKRLADYGSLCGASSVAGWEPVETVNR